MYLSPKSGIFFGFLQYENLELNYFLNRTLRSLSNITSVLNMWDMEEKEIEIYPKVLYNNEEGKLERLKA